MQALAQRLAGAPVAATVAMTARARAMRAAGREVIALTIGEPDFHTPRHAIEAAYQAALAGETKYPPQDGTPRLKAAVQRHFHARTGTLFPLDQLMVANGGKQVIFDALMATVDPGDEVIVPAPYWAAYVLTTRLVGGVVVPVSCPQNNGFRLRPEDLAAAITPRTRWLILNSPNNPTGAAYSAEELRALAEVLAPHSGIWVMADEIYADLVYDGRTPVSFAASAPDLRERTLTISGVSKSYAMTGWRIGFAAGPAGLIRGMVSVQGHATAGVSSVGQAAATAALEGDQGVVAEMVAAYARRRDLVLGALAEAPGIACHRPEGAFYVYPNIAGCLGRVSPGGARIDSDADFALALLEETGVAVVAGAAFGMSPYLRISYATSDALLAEACARIAGFCRGLR